MLKKLGFLCIIAIASFGFTKGEAGIAPRSFSITDTVDLQNKDSINQSIISLKDPKEDFKDLFATTTLSNGVNIAQLNPLAINFVEDYIDSHSKMLDGLKDKARPYFDMIDAVLVKHGLPKELKYLAVIESQLKSNAKSWAGAVGPWQFMPATGRLMGLKINRHTDERRDIYKSTHAASRYLTNLYSLYGDWLLVIAAYNGGPGKVNSAIKRSGSRDFWILQKYLPAESRKHVKKFIATHYIMEGEGGITTLTKKEAANFLLAGNAGTTVKDETGKSITQTINGRYNASVIVKHIAMDIADFRKLNPEFDNLIASSGKYELRLPADKMDAFKTKKIDILKESIQILLNPDAAVSTTF
ncbi:MAG TPA: lytic transglycosylase domain-containing protein [Chitinophagaceae bacterium]|nr:lytic transglycosylase domain-containing protein [Chitinophagaceae bacterium]